jgi:hypothetical protein
LQKPLFLLRVRFFLIDLWRLGYVLLLLRLWIFSVVFILRACSLYLIYNHFPVCPTYDLLQQLVNPSIFLDELFSNCVNCSDDRFYFRACNNSLIIRVYFPEYVKVACFSLRIICLLLICYVFHLLIYYYLSLSVLVACSHKKIRIYRLRKMI